MERLIHHNWPGNIRELQNCLKNAILTCRGGVTANDVHLPKMEEEARSDGRSVFSDLDDAWLDALDANLHAVVASEVERRLILYTLRRCVNNQVHASQLLGISRSMLRDRLNRYQRESGDRDEAAHG